MVWGCGEANSEIPAPRVSLTAPTQDSFHVGAAVLSPNPDSSWDYRSAEKWGADFTEPPDQETWFQPPFHHLCDLRYLGKSTLLFLLLYKAGTRSWPRGTVRTGWAA